MNCGATRLAISALLDGEPPNADLVEIDRHLDGCAECRAWREAAHQLTRSARLTPATARARPSAESLERIRAAYSETAKTRQTEVLRALLLVVAIAQLAVTIPMLLFGSDDAARDLGSMDMALTVGLLVVVWRPGRAQAISPVIGTAAALLAFTAILEVIRGKTELGWEAPHAVALAGWLLVRRIGWLTPPTAESPDRGRLRRLGWILAAWMLSALPTGRPLARGPRVSSHHGSSPVGSSTSVHSLPDGTVEPGALGETTERRAVA